MQKDASEGTVWHAQMAFPKSFGNVVNAKKAIEARGLNPLHYYLLTVLLGNRKQEIVDLTCSASDENVLPLPPLPNLNLSQGIGNYYVDLIIEEQLKSEGRKKRNEEIKSKQKNKQKKVEHLKKITKVCPPNWPPMITKLLMRLSKIWCLKEMLQLWPLRVQWNSGRRQQNPKKLRLERCT
jgi:hypothetical protein